MRSSYGLLAASGVLWAFSLAVIGTAFFVPSIGAEVSYVPKSSSEAQQPATSIPTSGISKDSHTIDLHTVAIDGLAVSPLGDQVVISIGSKKQVTESILAVSKDDDLSTFREIGLPRGYAWFYPTFYPDGNRITISSWCRDEAECGANGLGWHIWVIDVSGGEEPRRVTKRKDGLIRWRSYVSAEDEIYYVAVNNLGSPFRSEILASSAIVRLDPDGTEIAVFPNDAFQDDDGPEHFVIYSRGILFKSLEIVFAARDRLLVGGKASNYLTQDHMDRKKRFRSVGWSFGWQYDVRDERLLEFSQWMREEEIVRADYPMLSIRKTQNTLFEVQKEAVGISPLINPKLLSTLNKNTLPSYVHINLFAQRKSGREIIFQATDYSVFREKIWAYSDGRFQMIFDPPGGNSAALLLAASENDHMIAVYRTASLDANLEVADVVSSPLVVLMDRKDIIGISTILIEGRK